MRIDTRKIYCLLAERDMSQAALAQAAGVTATTVSNVLRGGGSCTPRTAGRLAGALGVGMLDLMGGEPDDGGCADD